MKNTSVTQNIELSNYSFEHTPTESSAGDILLYIAYHLSYKTHSDLNWLEYLQKFLIRIYFCWNNQPQKIKYYYQSQTCKNGCDWIWQYFKQSSEEKNDQEQKTVFHLGDFNIDLMHYNEHKLTNKFLDWLASNS